MKNYTIFLATLLLIFGNYSVALAQKEVNTKKRQQITIMLRIFLLYNTQTFRAFLTIGLMAYYNRKSGSPTLFSLHWAKTMTIVMIIGSGY